MYDCHSVAQGLFEDIICLSQASEDLVRKLELVCQQSFLVHRICMQSLGLGHIFPKCIFPQSVHQNWHPRLIKLKHLGFLKGFNSTCGFLWFKGYYGHIQILLNEVTPIKKISSVVLPLVPFFQFIFKLLYIIRNNDSYFYFICMCFDIKTQAVVFVNWYFLNSDHTSVFLNISS